MKNIIISTIIFAVFNFGALGLGAYLMGQGAGSEWYQNLNKAPWTPPGWVFGAAWTTIMICFSIYMAGLWKNTGSTNTVIFLFAIQWILNVMWNPFFFKYHQVLPALLVIIALTGVIAKLLFSNVSLLGYRSVWILPYFIWLLIATSLNAYIYIKN